MKKLLFIPLAILIFAGCQKEMNFDSNDQNDFLSQAAKASNKQARPLSGALSNAPVPGATPVVCSGAFPISGQNYLYGNVSHMGRLKSSSLAKALVCNITSVDPLRVMITYDEIWVAANGDKLLSSSSVDIVPDPLIENTGTFTGSGIIKGGTGRFEGATGNWNHLNGKYFADGTSTWTISGKIIY